LKFSRSRGGGSASWAGTFVRAQPTTRTENNKDFMLETAGAGAGNLEHAIPILQKNGQ
jgi:hypothetical protein